jgi:hypothetical protein
VVIVHPVAGVKIHRPGAIIEFAIRDDRLLIPVRGP